MTNTTPDTLIERLSYAASYRAAHDIGVYRELCEGAADAIEHLTAERDAALEDARRMRNLARFGLSMLDAHRGQQACEVGDIDGFTAQDSAVECGVLESREVAEPCGESCVCSGLDDFPLDCCFEADDTKAVRAAIAAQKGDDRAE